MEPILTSYRDSALYPQNLLSSRVFTHSSSLCSFRSRLAQAEPTLFGDSLRRPLNVIESGYKAEGYNEIDCQFTNDLHRLLWKRCDDALPDPMLRIVFIQPPSSKGHLNLTHDMFKKVMSYHQVMPSLLDFVLQWGNRAHMPNSLFVSLRSQCALSVQEPRWTLPYLGRSGYGYEVAFTLKSADVSPSHHEWDYSLRPITVYHSFDVRTGRSVWVLLRGDKLLSQRVKEATQYSNMIKPPTGSESGFEASMRMMLILCEFALENWQQYIQYIDERLTHLHQTRLREHNEMDTAAMKRAEAGFLSEPSEPRPNMLKTIKRALSNPISERKVPWNAQDANPMTNEHLPSEASLEGPPQPSHLETFEEAQALQKIEEHAKIAERTVLASAKTTKDLYELYTSTWSHSRFPANIRGPCGDNFDSFTSRLETFAAEYEALAGAIGHLLERTVRRKTHTYNIVGWNNTQVNYLLTRRAQASTESSLKLTKAALGFTQVAANEEKMMKVVTLVTLFFLPGTFISTFMSTDIIQYQDNRSSFSPKALGLFFSLCIPLMVITFIVTGLVYWWAQIRAKAHLRHLWPIGKTGSMA